MKLPPFTLPRTLLGGTLLTLSLAAPSPAQDRSPDLDLRVLYAGMIEHAETALFVDLLDDHFREVGTIAFEQLSAETAEGWDVVVIKLPNDGSWKPRNVRQGPTLPEGFDRPTLLVGVWAARMGENYRLKLNDW